MSKGFYCEEKGVCPIQYALSIIGQKWKIPILWHLFENNTVRFNELRRKLGTITNMMLTKSLKELEDNGLVNRKQYNTIPPHVEYSLTERGHSLYPALFELSKWGDKRFTLDKQAGIYVSKYYEE